MKSLKDKSVRQGPSMLVIYKVGVTLPRDKIRLLAKLCRVMAENFRKTLQKIIFSTPVSSAKITKMGPKKSIEYF